MTIYIIQHGEALSEEINPERPLSEKGKKDIQNLGRFLKKFVTNAKLIYHSPKKRAVETAELIRNELGKLKLVEIGSLLPKEKPEEVLDLINESREDLIIVGHMPHLGKLSGKILTGFEENCIFSFSPGSLLILENIEKEWKVLAFISPDFYP